MKKVFLFIVLFASVLLLRAQSVTEKLQKAYRQFESDPQLKYAISSLYVIDAKTGKVVFDKNSQIGLAPASTQKIITASAAFELLGKDFRYETQFKYAGNTTNKSVSGNIIIKPSGDPTFGSWRWKSTSENSIMDEFTSAIKQLNIPGYNDIIIDNNGWNSETIPDGWIWQDIGNYYGAGAAGLNWRENQFDIILKSGENIGDPVHIVKTNPHSFLNLVSYAQSAAKESGDNAYAYYPFNDSNGVVRGTIPINEDAFSISASNPFAAEQFVRILKNTLLTKLKIEQISSENHSYDTTLIFSHFSPSLDSIIYWFLKKSINLYGEALTKTFAYKINGIGSTDTGVPIIKNFWKQKGIDPDELNIKDGSGLSPQNRVTTHAQVEVLKYAKQQSWFPYFYKALPEYNDMKMKSGSINDVKGFCGYQTSKEGDEYIFSFLVNNYNGASSSVVQKMYKVLDILK
jgi:D-alanyl-D-alanine carboxypeptidase/D-alanyl-D-alanine-endopeptidase (penicillin-binding protein 4)